MEAASAGWLVVTLSGWLAGWLRLQLAGWQRLWLAGWAGWRRLWLAGLAGGWLLGYFASKLEFFGLHWSTYGYVRVRGSTVR